MKDVLKNNIFVKGAPNSITRMPRPVALPEIERPYAQPGEDRRPTIE